MALGVMVPVGDKKLYFRKTDGLGNLWMISLTDEVPKLVARTMLGVDFVVHENEIYFYAIDNLIEYMQLFKSDGSTDSSGEVVITQVSFFDTTRPYLPFIY